MCSKLWGKCIKVPHFGSHFVISGASICSRAWNECRAEMLDQVLPTCKPNKKAAISAGSAINCIWKSPCTNSRIVFLSQSKRIPAEKFTYLWRKLRSRLGICVGIKIFNYIKMDTHTQTEFAETATLTDGNGPLSRSWDKFCPES